MRSDNDADAAVDAAELFDGGDILDVAHAGSAELFGKDDSHEAEAGHLAYDVRGELAAFIALFASWQDFLSCERAYSVLQCLLLWRQNELHVDLLINKTYARIRLPNTWAIVQSPG